MNIIGVILFLAGVIAAGLQYLGKAPDALLNIGLAWPAWLGVSVLGAVILFLNKRAAD